MFDSTKSNVLFKDIESPRSFIEQVSFEDLAIGNIVNNFKILSSTFIPKRSGGFEIIAQGFFIRKVSRAEV